MQRIGHQPGAQGGAQNDNHFRGLHEHANGAVFHEEPANYGSQNYQYSYNREHSLFASSDLAWINTASAVDNFASLRGWLTPILRSLRLLGPLCIGTIRHGPPPCLSAI